MARVNYDKENAKALREEKYKIIKMIHDSDLDYDEYLQEVKKVKKIDQIMAGNKKPKMDGQTKAAIIKGVFSLVAIAGILVYENRDVFHSKTAVNMATRGI